MVKLVLNLIRDGKWKMSNPASSIQYPAISLQSAILSLHVAICNKRQGKFAYNKQQTTKNKQTNTLCTLLFAYLMPIKIKIKIKAKIKKFPKEMGIKKPSDGGTTGLDSLSSKGRGGPFERVGVIYTDLEYLSSCYLLI